MGDNDLKVDIDFDSLIADDKYQKSIKKKNIGKNHDSQPSPPEGKATHSSKKKINSESTNSILISMNFDQIHLNLEYIPNENEKVLSIIEILSELKEKL